LFQGYYAKYYGRGSGNARLERNKKFKKLRKKALKSHRLITVLPTRRKAYRKRGERNP